MTLTKYILRGVAFVGCAGLLAACGGGGSANAFAFEGIDEGTERFGNLVDTVGSAPQTQAGELPAVGTATHDGLVTLLADEDSKDGVVGTIRLKADLADDSFEGKAGDFYNLLGERAGGTVFISEGRVIRGPTVLLSAEVDGTVEFERGTETIEADAIGLFSGPTGDKTSAQIAGTSDGAPLIGLWVTQQQ